MKAQTSTEENLATVLSSVGALPSDLEPLNLMLGDREAEIIAESAGMLAEAAAEPEAAPQDEERRGEIIGESPGQISEKGYEMIVQFETGGQAYYEQIYKSAACWPGYSSGITIGFGFDLGYNTLVTFQQAWGDHLPAASYQRLQTAIGFRTTEPNRATKVTRARRLVRQFSDIPIPWGTGETVYINYTLPQQIAIVVRTVTNSVNLPAD